MTLSTVLSFLIAFANVFDSTIATLYSTSLRYEFQNHGCSLVDYGMLESDLDQRVGWRIETLLGDMQESYVVAAISVWYNYNAYVECSHLIGFCEDITESSLSDSYSMLSIYHQYNRIILRSNYYDVEYPVPFSTSNYFGNWNTAIIIHNAQSQVGSAVIFDSNGDLITYQSISLSDSQYFTEDDTDTFVNSRYGADNSTVYGSCSNQQNLMFHYSFGQVYDAGFILNFRSQPPQPIHYFDFRAWGYSVSNESIKYLQFKNLVKGIDGQADIYWNKYVSSYDQNTLMLVSDRESSISDFWYPTKGKLILSFTPIYISSTFYSEDSFEVFFQNKEQDKIQIGLVRRSYGLQLMVRFQGGQVEFNFAPSNCRQTIDLSLNNQGTQLAVRYFDRNIYYQTKYITLNSILSYERIAIGVYSSYFFSFGIKEFLTFNSGEVSYENIISPRCSLEVQFSKITGSAFCLVCLQSNQSPSINKGECNDITSNLMPRFSNLISATKVYTLYPYFQTKGIPMEIYKQSSEKWNFLVLGQFQLSSNYSLNQLMSLISIQIGGLSSRKQFMHLTLQTSNIIYFQIWFSQDQYYYKSIQLESDLINSHTIGIGYDQESQVVYCIFQNKKTTYFEMFPIFVSSELQVKYTQLLVLPHQSVVDFNINFKQFEGYSSDMRILQGVNRLTLTTDYYLKVYPNNQKLYSNFSPENYANLQNKGSFQFVCPNGAFFLGVCIQDGQCKNAILEQFSIYGINNSLYSTASKFGECIFCDGNCLQCTSSSTYCTLCIDGMRLDYNTRSCKLCPLGTYFYPEDNSCEKDCKVLGLLNDEINRKCVSSFNVKEYSFPILYQMRSFGRIFNYEYQEISSSEIPYLDQYVCWVEPSSPFPFEFLTSRLNFKQFLFKWKNLPKNYQKSVSLIILSSLNNLTNGTIKISVNNQVITNFETTLVVEESTIYCTLKSLDQSSNNNLIVAQINLSVLNNDDDFELKITSTNTIFGIRNIKASVSRCSPLCDSCSNGGRPQDCDSCSSYLSEFGDINGICTFPRGMFASGTNSYSSPSNVFLKCGSKCFVCEDDTKCLLCQQGYVLYDGNCVSSCPVNYGFDTFQTLSFNQTAYCVNQEKLIFDQQFGDCDYSQYLYFWIVEGKYKSDVYELNFKFNKQVPLLPNHKSIYLSLSLLIDQYEILNIQSDFIQIYQNNNSIFSGTNTHKNTLGSNFGCEYSPTKIIGYYDLEFTFAATESLSLQIVENFNYSGSKIKLTNFKLYLIRENNTLCKEMNSSRSSCSICVENASFVSSQCKCMNKYVYEYDYLTNMGVCKQCSPNCFTCTTTSAYTCLICAENYFFYQKICIKNCPEGTYYSSKIQTCSNCDSNCLTCSITLTQCNSCKVGLYLYQQQCFESCREIDSSLIQNEWNRSCDSFQVQDSINQLFSAENHFYPDTIKQFITISDSSSINGFFQCEPNNYLLGYFPQQAHLKTPILGQHQTIRLSFKLFSTCSTPPCRITIDFIDNQSTPQQLVTFLPKNQVCSIGNQQDISLTVSHERTQFGNLTILIKSPTNNRFAIGSITFTTIICHSTCRTCKGPLINDCLSCISDALLDTATSTCNCKIKGYGFKLGQDCTQNPFSCISCSKCLAPCVTCFKSEPYSCTSCTGNLFLQVSECVKSCATESYITKIESFRYCANLPGNCAKWDKFKNCYKCLQGYFFIANPQQCLKTCPIGYYESGIYCFPCKKDCISCIGELPEQCLVCATGYFKDPDTQSCKQCSKQCLTCTGPQSSDCIECNYSYFWFKPYAEEEIQVCTNTCFEVPGFYINFQNQSPYCHPCHSSCLSCIGSTYEDCLECLAPAYLENNICTIKCGEGFYSYYDQITYKMKCKQCGFSNCSSCNQIQCKACKSGFYLLYGSCVSCGNNCEVCSPQEGSICYKCLKGFVLFRSKCHLDCSNIEGYQLYENIVSRSCRECHSECHSCTGPNDFECTSCNQGSYFSSGMCIRCPANSKSCLIKNGQLLITQCYDTYKVFQNQCVESCPFGTYLEENRCFACHDACKGCTDSSQDSCLLCSKGYAKVGSTSTCLKCQNDQIMGMGDCKECSSQIFCDQCFSNILLDGKCYKNCPDQFYEDIPSHKCMNCVYPCHNCSSLNTCTSCAEGYYLPNGLKTCKKCNPICESCQDVGNSKISCTKCLQDLYSQIQPDLSTTCTKVCDLGYFPDTTNMKCQLCNQSCSSCQNSESCISCAVGYFFSRTNKLCTKCKEGCLDCTSSQICLKCGSPFNFHEGSCLQECPYGTVGKNQVCIPCSKICESCQVTIEKCTSCPYGSYLSGTTCLKCDSSCKECHQTATSCISCNSGFYLENGACKNTCFSVGVFPDPQTWTCEKCHPTCKTCIGPYIRQCTSCHNSTFLLSQDNNMNNLGICQACHEDCLSCFGPENIQCSACVTGIQYEPNRNRCIRNLDEKYYDIISRVPRKCSSFCATCFGPEPNECRSCKDGFYLDKNLNTCQSCPSTCELCSSNTQCHKCYSGYILYGSKCMTSCPNGMRVSIEGICICHSTCGKCTVDLEAYSSTCKKCSNTSYVLYQENPNCILTSECKGFIDIQNQECVEKCSDNKFIDRKKKTCSLLPCSEDTFTLDKRDCVEKCPLGYYTDTQQRECLKCHENCNSCFGSSFNECYSCKDSIYYHPNILTCKDRCLLGYVQQDPNILECHICEEGCKVCLESYLKLNNQCLVECPIGYSAVLQQCVKSQISTLRIKGKNIKQLYSIEKDIIIEAELFNIFTAKPKITWKNTFSSEISFATQFPKVASSSLFQLIPYLFLRGGNKYSFRIEAEFMNGSIVYDEITINTIGEIKQGAFIVNQSSGQSNRTPFSFSFSGWKFENQLYYSLSFYQLLGLIYPSENQISDYVKEKLFQIHSNTTLNQSIETTIQLIFPPFDQDTKLICELKVNNVDQSVQSFSYLLIDLKAWSGNLQDNILQLHQDVSQLSSKNEIEILLYAIRLSRQIKYQESEKNLLEETKNLRIQARRMGINSSQLADCDDQIDCYRNGLCNGDLSIQQCECDNEYTGTNCEWTIDQANIIEISSSVLIQQNKNINTLSIRLQILEILFTYSSFLNYSPSLKKILELMTQQLTIGIKEISNSNVIDSNVGQITTRSLSMSISQLQKIGYDVQTLLELSSQLLLRQQTTLNLGQTQLTTSEACETFLYPLLFDTDMNSTFSRKGSKKNKSSFDIVFSDLSVEFPSELISNNLKQVVQIQKWNYPSRLNPDALSESVSISFSQNGKRVTVKDLSVPIIFSLPKYISSPVNSNSEAVVCTYYDEDTSQFSDEGCNLVKETLTEIVCSCNHLTEFQAAINPKVNQDAQQLSKLIEAVNQGKKIKLSNQSKIITIKSLPTPQIGSRSISLTSVMSQQQQIRSSPSIQFIVLKESGEVVPPNYGSLDKIENVGIEKRKIIDQQENQTKKSEDILDKRFLIIYSIIIFILGLFFSLRASPKYEFINESTDFISKYKKNKQKQQIHSVDRQHVKNKKNKVEKITDKKSEFVSLSFKEVSINNTTQNKSILEDQQLMSQRESNISNISIDLDKSTKFKKTQNFRKQNKRRVTQNRQEYKISVIKEVEDEKTQQSIFEDIEEPIIMKQQSDQQEEKLEIQGTEIQMIEIQKQTIIDNSQRAKTKTSLQTIESKLELIDPISNDPRPKNQQKHSVRQPRKHLREEFEINIEDLEQNNKPTREIQLNRLKFVKKHYNIILQEYNQQINKFQKKNLSQLKIEKFEYQNEEINIKNPIKLRDIKQTKRQSMPEIFIKLTKKSQIIRKKQKRIFEEIIFEQKQIIERKLDHLVATLNLERQKQITQLNNYLNVIHNQIDNILNISTLRIFQIGFFMEQETRLFSDKFTNSIQFCSQIVLTALINIYLKCLDQNSGDYEIFYFNYKRIGTSFVVSYLLTTFFFGLLTSIFVKLANEMKQIKFKRINSLRAQFMAFYQIIGFIFFGVSIGGVIVLSDQQVALIFPIEVLKDTFISMVLSFLIFDGVAFLLVEILEAFKIQNSVVHFFIGCRGYYYYQGFDNPLVYKSYYQQKILNSKKSGIVTKNNLFNK